MREVFSDQGRLFSYISPEARVPANHPLRKIRMLVRDVNRSLSRLYASEGRSSIPPEQLLSALLLQVLYGIRSERQLMEGQKRKNDTHASTTDPDCRLYRKAAQRHGKQHGTMRKTQHRGIAGVAADFLLNLIAYNLIRIPKLVAARQNSTLIREDNGSVSRFFRKLLDLIDELDPTLFRRGAFSCGRSGNRAARGR
jgi:hypothetical protein